MTTLYYESSFAHHGVKGQKWGVRRYQNPDGTLTDRGKLHAAKQDASIERGKSINNRKYGIKGRMTKHASDLAIANTTSFASRGALRAIYDRAKTTKSEMPTMLKEIHGSILEPKELNDIISSRVKELDTVMSVASNASTTLAAGTAVFNICKGIKIAKDIHDYRNYQKSEILKRYS